jgi:hypothetical protein
MITAVIGTTKSPSPRVDHLETLDRGQHRDRGGDHAVAEEQRRTEETRRCQRRRRAPPTRAGPPPQQRDERHDAALTVVVRSHHQRDVGERDDDHHRPEDQRHDAVDMTIADRHGMWVTRVEDGLDRVDRAGADVAEHHAERGDDHRRTQRLGLGFSGCPHPTIISERTVVCVRNRPAGPHCTYLPDPVTPIRWTLAT